MKTLISIHDVMPTTIEQVAELLRLCRRYNRSNVTLLIVPGLPWTSQQITQIKSWQQQGFDLAGHGWTHRAESISGIYHRMHSFFVSRRVAEHLCLDGPAIHRLMCDCADWFGHNGMQIPNLYVPPAWALGKISNEQLAMSPFRIVESLAGIQTTDGTWRQDLPLVGYEADTALRKWFLRRFNRWNERKAKAKNVPLRVSIHPFDHRYRLRKDLESMLAVEQDCKRYAEVVDPEPTANQISISPNTNANLLEPS